MKKTNLCLLIDVLMFLFLALMSGVGLLIKYILLPGSKRWDVYGRDRFLHGQGQHDNLPAAARNEESTRVLT